MGVPLLQQVRVGAYIMKQRLRGTERYPLVLMLEPLFRCNLACPGCGKIDYPNAILNRRLSAAECIAAAEECGAPIVSIAGGEPLIHKEIGEIVDGLVARKRFVYLCTNGLLVEKKIDLLKPSPYLTIQIHLDGLGEHHDKAVAQDGVFDKAIEAIRLVKSKGFRVNINTTFFDNATAEEAARLFDFASEIGVDGITVSPGYAYERAPDQQHFMTRKRTKQFFRDLLRIGYEKKAKWPISQSPLFLDFLAGNQDYNCTPWGNPTRNVFGWQRPCYLLNEGYVATFRELMEETEWERYGTGNYEKCADCMVHCGYEASAVKDIVRNPLKGLKVALKGIRTSGPMAPEINLSNQRPAEYVFDRLVETAMSDAPAGKQGGKTSNAA
ncbi:MAG: adenosyl-hopene transferase HpnH [Pseudomonadota bacterium]|nr:adenosyl-hopene transferase HpnH [Pseudomonadota bacterium]